MLRIPKPLRTYLPARAARDTRGVTLIELLLYVSIAGIFLFVITTLAVSMLQMRVKNTAIEEVNEQASAAMQQIIQTVRNASAIVNPPVGVTGSTLEIASISTSDSPTKYDVAGGVLRITQGLGTPVTLTNSNVTVSNFSARNLSRSGTHGTVQIKFTITYNNPSGRNEYDYSTPITASATIR